MSIRIKFLLLIFSSIGGTLLLLILFLSTDYAQNEWAYFRFYPYVEMASRDKRNAPAIPEKRPPATDLQLAQKPVPEEILSLPHELPQTLAIRQTLFLTPFSPTETLTIQSKNQAKNQTKNLITPRSPPDIKKKPGLNKEPAPQIPPEIPPAENWRHAAKRGYDAYARFDYERAILYFDQALKDMPDNRELHLQLAYAHKALGNKSQALNHFKSAIEHSKVVPFTLRREVERLDNRFSLDGYVIYRAESSGPRPLGADLTQSQAGLEGTYHLENPSVQTYARLLSAMEKGHLTPNPDSYQAGLGLKVKPLSGHNLVLSAERLVKIGGFARNDWMLRVGYSLNQGTDYREDRTEWWSYSLYLDAALIDPADPDIFLTVQITGGYSMILAPGLLLQPRLTGLVTWQKDSFRLASLIEAGPGLNVRYYFNETKYQAYRSYLDLSLDYRLKLSGTSIGSSGPVVSLLLHF